MKTGVSATRSAVESTERTMRSPATQPTNTGQKASLGRGGGKLKMVRVPAPQRPEINEVRMTPTMYVAQVFLSPTSSPTSRPSRARASPV